MEIRVVPEARMNFLNLAMLSTENAAIRVFGIATVYRGAEGERILIFESSSKLANFFDASRLPERFAQSGFEVGVAESEAGVEQALGAYAAAVEEFGAEFLQGEAHGEFGDACDAGSV